jgi:hypothetical protein
MNFNYPLNLLKEKEINFLKNKNINIKNINITNNIEKINILFNIFDHFFYYKKYKNNNFLINLKNEIYKKCNLNFNKYDIYILLKKYHNNINNFIKIKKLKAAFNVEFKNISQYGGFITNDKKYSSYTYALNVTDLIFDLIAILPQDLFTTSRNPITMPFSFLSVIMNLMRGDYEFAFYSLISTVPSIGGIISISAKMIHRIIRAVNGTKNVDTKKNVEYFKQILSARRVHNFLKKGANRNHIFEGRFEKEYKSSFDDEYL